MAKKKAVFDKDETEILSAFESGGMVSVEDVEIEKTKAMTAAKNTKAKTKQVSIRLPVKDLVAIQKKSRGCRSSISDAYQPADSPVYSQSKINLVV